MPNSAVAIDPDRTTILHTIASNGDALSDLGDQLARIEISLYGAHPQLAEPTKEKEVSENVEALLDRQAGLIRQNSEIALRILNSLI